MIDSAAISSTNADSRRGHAGAASRSRAAPRYPRAHFERAAHEDQHTEPGQKENEARTDRRTERDDRRRGDRSGQHEQREQEAALPVVAPQPAGKEQRAGERAERRAESDLQSADELRRRPFRRRDGCRPRRLREELTERRRASARRGRASPRPPARIPAPVRLQRRHASRSKPGTPSSSAHAAACATTTNTIVRCVYAPSAAVMPYAT